MFVRKKFDALSLFFAAVLIVAAAGGGYLAFDYGWLHSWLELLGCVGIAGLVIAFAVLEGAPAAAPQLADVVDQKAHGRARDATETEALTSLGQSADRPEREFSE